MLPSAVRNYQILYCSAKDKPFCVPRCEPLQSTELNGVKVVYLSVG